MQQRWVDITMDMAMVAVSIAIAIKCVMIRTRLTMNDNEPVRKEYIDYVILDDDMQEADSATVEVDTKMPVVRSAKTEVVTLRHDIELMYEGMKVSYTSPRVDLLKRVAQVKINQHEVDKNNEVIKDKLAEYGIMVTLGIAVVGPSVTMYKVAPSAGVKVKQIESLNTDLALALRCNAVRIVPVQNDNKIGIEVPNRTVAVVTAREAFEASEFRNCNYALPVVIGKAIDGSMKVVDLATMPHLLIAGATGTGKSVAINMLIVSLLYKKEPENLRFVMIDPKKVELSIFEGIREQFLLNLTGDEKAIITDTSKAAFVLSELCSIMDSRYSQLEAAKVRNIGEYNAKKPKDQLFFIVVVIDELADLMMTTGKDKGSSVELYLCRLAQLARAVGIHLIVATQRPSVNVITGTIKTNFPTRLSFQVASGVDSKTILDSTGAENLIGKGDCLLVNGSRMERLQGALITTEEVNKVCDFVGKQKGFSTDRKEYTPTLQVDQNSDDLLEKAILLCREAGKCNVTFLREQLGIGYSRASKLISPIQEALTPINNG